MHVICNNDIAKPGKVMNDIIEHSGEIYEIDGSRVRVRIVQVAACAGCKAKSLCSQSETKEKFVDVYDDNSERWKVGEAVNVCGTLSMGRRAVWQAFGVPTVLIVIALLVSKLALGCSDGVSVLAAFAMAGCYFAAMYMVRDKIERKFVMWIERPKEHVAY